MPTYREAAERLAQEVGRLLGARLEPASELSLGDSEAYMYIGDGHEFTVRCGPCGCEAMLRRDDEPLAYCGLKCGPDPQARDSGEALEAAAILEAALEKARVPRLREC